MEITGRIGKVLPMRSGVSARTGNEWKVLPFIFEYFNAPSDIYACRIIFDAMNEDLFPQIVEGRTVTISMKHAVTEYEGRYFNQVRLTGFRVIDATTPQQAPQQAQTTAGVQQTATNENAPQNAPKDEADDLPF